MVRAGGRLRALRLGMIAMVGVMALWSAGSAPRAFAADFVTVTLAPVLPMYYGEPVVLSATVSPVSGTGSPTGMVTFYDGAPPGGTFLGTGTPGPNNTWALGVPAPLTAGPHTIYAVYGGDANFTGNTGSGPLLVEQATTSTTITKTDPQPSIVGGSVTVSYTVAVTNGIGTPTGDVTVSDGAGHSCTGSVAAGQCSIIFPAAGAPSLVATYAGDTNFAGSADTGYVQTVNQASDTVAVDTSGTPSGLGDLVTFTAIVAPVPVSAGTPTGSVTFVADEGTSSQTNLCPGVALDASGEATCATSALTVGSHSITAHYGGDSTFMPGAGALSSPQFVSDDSGPTTFDVQASTDPATSLPIFSAGEAMAPGQPGGVSAAEYFVDPSVDSPALPGTGVSMLATTGMFGDANVQVSAIMPLSTFGALLPGTHTVVINGEDSNSIWGPLQSTTFSVPAATAPATSKGLASVSPLVSDGSTQTTLSIDITPGLHPFSTGLSATVDLRAIGGSATQALYDDGTHGDAAKNDGVYSVQITVPEGTLPTSYSFPVSVKDDQKRTGSGSIPLTVSSPTSAVAGPIDTEVSNNTQAEATVGGAGAFSTGSYTAIATDGSPPDSLTVAAYDKNPVDGGDPSSGGASFQYFDVKLSPGNGFDDVVVTDCNVSSSSDIWWYNASAAAWEDMANANLNSTSHPGCLSFTVVPAGFGGGTANAPTMDQLVGTVFASTGGATTSSLLARSSLARHGATLTVKWKLADPSGIIGFRVYAGTKQLTHHLIPAHASKSYHFTTRYTGHQPVTLHILQASGQEVIAPVG